MMCVHPASILRGISSSRPSRLSPTGLATRSPDEAGTSAHARHAQHSTVRSPDDRLRSKLDGSASMRSELAAFAEYRIGTTVGEMATVPARLVEGMSGTRDGYKFLVRSPDTRESPGCRIEPVDTMWCLTFSVEVQVSGPRDELDPDGAIVLNRQIATDLFTRLILKAPTLGFPGAQPRCESQSVTIDGRPAALDPDIHRDPNSVILVPDGVVTMDELLDGARGSQPPSRARMMAAEAGYQVLFNPNASKVTAIVVAASACEVAAHACVHATTTDDLHRLTDWLIPTDKQAPLSPLKVIDILIPALTSRRLCNEDSELWKDVKALFAARDTAVHQGRLPDRTPATRLVNQAKRLIEWVETIPTRIED